MYQVNIQNQLFSAALPLKPLTAWAGSACSVTVAVPPALAGLGVSGVGVTLSLPDGRTVNAAAVQVAGTPLWVATFAADDFATSGHVAQGLMITIAGTDEHGVVRTWIIAKGDVDVMDGDAAPVSGGSYYAVKLRDAAPEDPVEGDAYVSGGALLIYHDGEWVTIGGVDISGKLDGSAAYPAWEAGPYGENSIVSHNGKLWKCLLATTMEPPSEDWEEVTLQSLLAAKQDALSQSQLAAVNSGATPEKVATWDGYAAQIAQKASLTDLPYRLVTPGKWEYALSVELTNFSVNELFYDDGTYSGETKWVLRYYSDETGSEELYSNEPQDALVLDFGGITATRPSLPGHLLDRAGNRVVVTGDTTLTLPAAITGYARDFLVRLTVSATSTVTWSASSGETITWDAMGAPPASFAASATPYLYRFTEVAPGVFHAEDMMALVGLEAALAAINGGVAS